MIPAVRQVHMPVSSLTSSAFPTLFQMGRLYRIPPLRDFTADQISRSLPFLIRSGLLVCSPPRSPLPLRLKAQVSCDFYTRADHASLPLRTSGMLAV